MTEDPAARPPAPLRWAIRLLAAEAVVVALLCVYVVYSTVTADAVVVRDAALVIGFAAMMAALLWLAAWALSRRQAWARGPAVVLELMLLPIGYFMIAAGVFWTGIPVCVFGLVGAGLLVSPATRAALGVKSQFSGG